MANRIPPYTIGKPAEHRTLSFFGEAKDKPRVGTQEFLESHPLPDAVKKRAVWIVHGMGQQVPFETLDSLAQGLLMAASEKPNGWEVLPPPRVVSAKFLSPDSSSKTQVVQRVEIELEQSGTGRRLELHLYEAYWAPLTEGVAKLSDVLSFLYDGALHGLLNCIRPFRRAMFPDDASKVISPPQTEGKCDEGLWKFRIPPFAPMEIITLLLIVLALAVINTVILAASAAKLKFPIFGSLPISTDWDQLTAIATAVTAIALTFGAVLYLAEMSRPANLSPVAKGFICYLSWVSVSITAVSIVIAAGCMGLISRFSTVALWIQKGMNLHATQIVSTTVMWVALVLCAYASLRRADKRGRGVDHRAGPFPLYLFLAGYLVHIGLLFLLVFVQSSRFFDSTLFPLAPQHVIDILSSGFWVWPALLALSKLIGNLIVEYPGDVAIYVAPNKLDRFNEVRQKIKQLALDSLMPLYSARGASLQVPLYSEVAVIGHSLGSVIAYDTLNQLLILDDLSKNLFHVADRTCIFETFGSPLDKTAFFFSYQGTENFNIREQLAASVQPLIQSYARFRKFPWVNVYSRSDIICGSLKFYDVNPPSSAVPNPTYPVSNVRDPDAVVPLIAHVEYWKNRTLWNRLFDRVTA